MKLLREILTEKFKICLRRVSCGHFLVMSTDFVFCYFQFESDCFIASEKFKTEPVFRENCTINLGVVHFLNLYVL